MRVLSHAFSLLVLSCLVAAAPAFADEEHQHPAGDPEKLGSVSFPTSCAPAVQKQFQRGVAMMHSFWYEEAERTFNQVAQADPGCAMACVGPPLVPPVEALAEETLPELGSRIGSASSYTVPH
jgi:hypothetical protein